jgi:hypothetical protein
MPNSHCAIYDFKKPLTKTLPNDIIQYFKKLQMLNVYYINMQMSCSKQIVHHAIFLQ